MSRHFFIQFDKLPGAPKHKLKGEMIVGSEEGDIILKGKNRVSAKHCSLKVEGDVVCLTDFNSDSGTFVNGQEIRANKIFLLNVGDLVKVGSISFTLKTDSPQELPAVDSHFEKEEKKPQLKSLENQEPEKNQMNELSELIPANEEEIDITQEKSKKKNKKRAGTWASFKAVAVFMDFLMAMTLDTLIGPYLFYQQINSQIESILKALFEPLSKKTEITHEIFLLVVPYFKFVLLYFLIRFLGAIIFSVSPGQFLMGMRNFASASMGRASAVARTFIEILTTPFLIFDLPSLFNLRTFKEVITFSQVGIKYKAYTFIGITLILPTLALLALASPLYKGFQVRNSVDLKSYDPGLHFPKGEIQKSYSEFLNLDLSYERTMKMYPFFELSEKKGKKQLVFKLRVYDSQNKSSAFFSLVKTFSFKKLFQIAAEMNPLFHIHYPHVNNYIKDVSSENKNFREHQWSENDKEQISREMQLVIEESFQLSGQNLINHIQKRGPFIKGHIDFADTLRELFDEEITGVQLITLDEVRYMRAIVDKSGSALKHYLIPLMAQKGHIFMMEFYSRDNVKNFYQNFLSGLKLKDEKSVQQVRQANLLTIADDVMKDRINEELFNSYGQFVFKTYYNRASETLKTGDMKQFAIIHESLKSLVQIFEIQLRKFEQGNKNFGQKVKVNLHDLLQAVEDKNTEFFSSGE